MISSAGISMGASRMISSSMEFSIKISKSGSIRADLAASAGRAAAGASSAMIVYEYCLVEGAGE